MQKKSILYRYSFHQSFHWLTVGLIIPVMTLLQIEKGLNLFQVGITAAAYSGAVLLMELPTGGLADAIGRRKVYSISLLISLGALGVLLFARSFPLIFISLFLLGISRALSSGTVDAWFVDELLYADPEIDLHQYQAKAGIFLPAGVAGGTLLGGIIPRVFGGFFQNSTPFGTYGSSIVFQAAAVCIQVLLTSLLIHETAPHKKTNFRTGLKEVPQILKHAVTYGIRNRNIFLFLISMGIFGFGLAGIEQFWQPRIKTILGDSFNTILLGLISTGYFLAASAGNLIAIPLGRGMKHRHTLILFLTRLSLGFFLLLLSFTAKTSGFVVFYITLFTFNGIGSPSEQTFFNMNIPSDKRSSLLSLLSLFLQAGGVFGLLTQGYIAEHNSIQSAWFVGAVVLILSSVLFLFIRERGVTAK